MANQATWEERTGARERVAGIKKSCVTELIDGRRAITWPMGAAVVWLDVHVSLVREGE